MDLAGASDGLPESRRLALREVLSALPGLLAGKGAAGRPGCVQLHGLEGSLLPLVAAQLASAKGTRLPLVVVAKSGASAGALARDLQFFLPEPTGVDDPTRPPRVMLMPELETTPWADVSPDR